MMKLNQLSYLCQILERHKIPATELLIKGKETNRLSFTMAKRYTERLERTCAQYDLRLTTSYDSFITRNKHRYHIEFRRTYL